MTFQFYYSKLGPTLSCDNHTFLNKNITFESYILMQYKSENVMREYLISPKRL